MGWDRVDSIAAHYGLDGMGDQIPVGAEFLDFVHHPDRPWPSQAPVQCILGLFPEGKAAGVCVDYPLPSSVEVKGRVELYLLLFHCAFMACCRVKFMITCTSVMCISDDVTSSCSRLYSLSPCCSLQLYYGISVPGSRTYVVSESIRF